jgi:eukaryotic-like serine/threonine-protein kinase
MVLVANRQRELSVPVDRARKYCFQVRATDSRNIYTSEPVPVRGARCGL